MMKNPGCILFTIVLLTVLAITIPYLWQVLMIVLRPQGISVWRQLELYQWLALGMGLFILIKGMVRNNLTWLETFSHEFTHTIVALCFFRRIHSFNAGEGSGVIYTSGTDTISHVPVSLAPYCFPVFTYMLLAIRCLIVSQGLCVFDVLVGLTLALHVHCFLTQTGSYQTDINQFPLPFSYLYIIVMNILNICIIWVAFFPQYNLYTSFWRMLCAQWEQLQVLYAMIF